MVWTWVRVSVRVRVRVLVRLRVQNVGQNYKKTIKTTHVIVLLYYFNLQMHKTM